MFNWKDCKEFSFVKLLLATFVPSGIAYFGFHFILPSLVDRGVPVLLSYGTVASSMLLLLLVFTIYVLAKESRELGVSLKERMLLKRLNRKDILISIVLFIVTMLMISLGMFLSKKLVVILGIEVPEYLPFFLNPTIDPATADPIILSSGISLTGRWGIFAILTIAIVLNILTEELYFRAWLLPKTWKYGRFIWVINGSLFAFYHTYQLWLLPTILIASLGFAFICYKTKSIVAPFVFHIITNILSVISLFPLFI